MGKRDWQFNIENFEPMEDANYVLLAIAERLGALVEIGDNLEEVADLWANSLAFGGQPVGGIDEPVPATRSAWMCDRDNECVLMKGHAGECVHMPPQFCQCIKPALGTGGVCGKCGFPGKPGTIYEVER